jgi:hypothetical protein
VSEEGQAFIAQVRSFLAEEEFKRAEDLLRNAPKNRSGWRPQENDEVLALREFLDSLKYPEIR